MVCGIEIANGDLPPVYQPYLTWAFNAPH
jgi:hypothetical protein